MLEGTACEEPTERDRESIELRQLRHPVTSLMGTGRRCQYGFPQAFMLNPQGRFRAGLKRIPLDAGLFRLSCPFLVRAIDEWESEGAVQDFNTRILASEALHADLQEINNRHRSIRRHVVGEVDSAALDADPVGNIILNSGLAGLTVDDDVKCLHALLADALCRREHTELHKEVLRGLRRRNTSLDGCANCWQQCDASNQESPSSWSYTPAKNKQKLRQTIARRKELRARKRHL